MNKTTIFLLIFLISFGSIGAVAFTPGLPMIAQDFGISESVAQAVMTWFLFGYAFGQLLYGPFANRFGSTKAIFFGAGLEILGALGCAMSGYFHVFALLLFFRLVMALGVAVGLKITFTLCGKLLSKQEAARVMGLLTVSFAITPALGVFIGGLLVKYFNWEATFYFMAFYGLFIFFSAFFLPEAYSELDVHALKIKSIIKNYWKQFKSLHLISGAFLLGSGTAINYIFATLCPFIAMGVMHLSPSEYGAYYFIPSVGILIGSFASSYVGKFINPERSLSLGLGFVFIGSALLLACLFYFGAAPLSLFLPVMLIYFGMSFIFGNTSALALHRAEDKGNASAVLSFLNMASSFVAVLILGLFTISQAIVLPLIYLGLCVWALFWFRMLKE